MPADFEHETRAREAIRTALTTVPFYVKQGLASRIDGSNGVAADAPVNELLRHLPLLTRDKVRPTLPKQWFPEGRDAKAELAAGKISVIEVGMGASRVRVLFDPHAYVAQQKRALGVEGAWRDAVLWVPERGTGSCGAGDPGYEGASRYGQCRVYFNNITPVNSQELRDLAFKRLDAIVKRAGGPEALKNDPDKVPQVHIRGDVNAPWRCIAGAIYNVQISGYPTVGFISNPIDPNAP